METPFTTEQFYQVFEQYNSTIYPAQLFLIALGIAAIFLIQSEWPAKNKIISWFIGILWIWMGLIYHIAFFTAINKAAYVFGLIFIFEGILIILNSGNNRITFSFKPTTKVYTGLFFIIFGLIVYPVIGLFIHGTSVPVISLGLPCPTTIFTFGFFMLAGSKLPKYLLIIPSLWAVVGLSAAINFGVYQDFMILIAAVFLWVPAFSRSRE